MFYTTQVSCPFDTLTLFAQDEQLTGLSFSSQPGSSFFPAAMCDANRDIFRHTRQWLSRYFAGEAPDPRELALAPSGTAFQKAVWQLLLHIPYGEVVSYGALAARVCKSMGLKSMSPRAVGGALHRNPIAIILPCHRVVKSDGGLGGYAGGLPLKRKLLALEGVDLSRFSGRHRITPVFQEPYPPLF